MQYGIRKLANPTGTSAVVRFLCLFSVMAGAALAGTWSGALVDAGCYQSAKNNRNAYDLPGVRDVNMDIRGCAPKAKTHSFAIVLPNSEDFVLDAAGNSQAAQLVRQEVGKNPLRVTVNGEMRNEIIAVSSIAREP